MKKICPFGCIIYRWAVNTDRTRQRVVRMKEIFALILMAQAIITSGGAAVTAKERGGTGKDVHVCCTVPATGKAEKDVFILKVPDGFMSAYVSYDRAVLSEKFSTDATLYYIAQKPGKENITVYISDDDGNIYCEEYILMIDDDLEMTLVDHLTDHPVLY